MINFACYVRKLFVELTFPNPCTFMEKAKLLSSCKSFQLYKVTIKKPHKVTACDQEYPTLCTLAVTRLILHVHYTMTLAVCPCDTSKVLHFKSFRVYHYSRKIWWSNAWQFCIKICYNWQSILQRNSPLTPQ